MAFENISLFARLWQKRGLGLLLQNEVVAEDKSLLSYGRKENWAAKEASALSAQNANLSAKPSNAFGPRSMAPKPSPRQMSSPNQGQVVLPRQRLAPSQAQGQTPISRLTPRATQNPSGEELRFSPKPSLPLLPSSDKWPRKWQELLKSVQPGRVVWSYPKLGFDLRHFKTAGLEERRAFLQRLLSEKPRYPAGTHTFWPYILPEEEHEKNLAPNPELFWAGVRALGARVVFLLGPESGAHLVQLDFPYAVKRAYGA
ncbi:MAG: hypothetical protein IJS50_00370, partial [Desulfovibrio sp.]|nr:hypothetical protein [Desulfovibrio sp.]